MTTKNLVILAGVAAVLGGAAYWTTSDKKMKTPSIVGKKILPAFAAADVARVEIDGDKKLALAATDAGWVVETLHNHPADVAKIRENILKLGELKVGQVAAGKKIENPATISLKDAKGDSIAILQAGETHMAKPKGQMAQFGGGGYPDGRYVRFEDKTVLVKDALEAFDGDAKKWIDTRIASVPAADVEKVTFVKGGETVELVRKDGNWKLAGLADKEELDASKTYSLDSALAYLDMTGVADPKLTDAELGFATGAVYTATLKNGASYTAKTGNKTGGDCWVKLSATFKAVGTNAVENAQLEQAVKAFNEKVGKWTYSVSAYSAGNFAKMRKDLVKAKEEPKKEEEKK